jgi:hypothetical protein
VLVYLFQLVVFGFKCFGGKETMPKAISTEPLTQMLRSITLQRQTGLLRVECFGGGNREQGEIYFEGGHPVRAQAGQETGKAALKLISNWRYIVYSFARIDRPYPANLPALPAAKEQRIESEPPTRPFPASAFQAVNPARTPLPPSREREQSQRETGPQRVPGARPAPSQISASTEPVPSANPILSTSQRSTTQPLVSCGDTLETYGPSQPSAVSRANQPLNVRQAAVSPRRLLAPPRLEPLPGGEPSLEKLAIFRAKAQNITKKFLQQMERRDRIIFILVDGTRTIQDIAYLTNYSEIEVEQVLICLTKKGYTERVLDSHTTTAVRDKQADISPPIQGKMSHKA